LRRPEGFTRRAFETEAIRVTPNNMRAVAEWCNGRVVEDENPHIEFKPAMPNYGGRLARAHQGDWIMRASKGFKLYRDKQFREAFEPKRNNSMKFDEILSVVKEAMRKQDAATYLGVSGDTKDVAQKATLRILKITQ